MRIVDVQVHLIPYPAQPAFRWRAGLPGSEPAVTGAILRLITDTGIEGLAITGRGIILADLVDRRLRRLRAHQRGAQGRSHRRHADRPPG